MRGEIIVLHAVTNDFRKAHITNFSVLYDWKLLEFIKNNSLPSNSNLIFLDSYKIFPKIFKICLAIWH